MRWCLALAAYCVQALTAAELRTVGSWALSPTVDGPGELRFDDRPLVERVTFCGYQPAWKGGRFDARGAELAVSDDGRTFTWRKSVPGQVEMTLSLVLTEDTATWQVEALVQPSGPCEFGLYLPIASVQRQDGGMVLAEGGRRLVEVDERTFPSRGVGDRLVFEMPDQRLTWRCHSAPGRFSLQDWRDRQPSALRLISVLAVGEAPTRVTASAQLTVEAFAGAELEHRRRHLGQRTRWVERVEVRNPGFEDGARDWNLPPNGAIAETGAHGAQKAAHLRVTDPSAESVYITRNIPVTGGARYAVGCWVRAKGVEAKPGRMPSVGAGLIVEWADRKGKWFAAGEYACDLFGDHDWTERTCAGLRAPEEAGFAVVFLALRGAGEAWFDDLSLTQIHQSLALEAPEPGSELQENRPLLRWRDDPHAAEFAVCLSLDPTFPEGATRQASALENVWRSSEPLATGTWYWRVSAPGYEPSTAWSFRQHASVDRDTTAPELLSAVSRVTEPGQAAVIKLREPGDAPPSVTLHGEGQAAGTAPVERLGDDLWLARVPPLGRWEPGLNQVRGTVCDAAGNRVVVSFPVVFRAIPGNAVRIEADGAYSSGGQRTFPLGVYQVSPEAMPRVKAGGFGIVHTYTWESSQDDSGARQYLDDAWRNGLRVFVGFDRGLGTGDGLVQGNKEHVVRRVAALCDHPGLFCWYLFDEPEVPGQYVAPRSLVQYAELIRAADPFHPVVVTTWGARMNQYRQSWDTHWTQAYAPPAGVVKTLGEHRALLQDRSPITLLVHCYDQAQKGSGTVELDRFQPDAAWLRAAAYAGITQRINGLFWWWFGDHQRQYLTVAHVPWAWEALTRVISELHQLEAPLVDAAAAVTTSLEVPGGKIEIWSKTCAGQTWAIAVNTGETEVKAALPLAAADGPATVCFEQRTVQRVGGTIEDTFGRYAVHVYSWPQ